MLEKERIKRRERKRERTIRIDLEVEHFQEPLKQK